jgi:YrbI family 3-deoxy-D-manno-octulosonate 8-phosphate phosphatase
MSAESPISSRDIQLLVYDFDGVMTDSRVFVLPDGSEAVACNRSDGLAVEIIRSKGLRQVILSTETNKIVQTRARKIGLPVIDSVKNKKECLVAHCRKHDVSPERVAYVGNEVNDLEAMKFVGWPICPQDAHPRVKQVAKTILTTKGGEGVIRELADILFDD